MCSFIGQILYGVVMAAALGLTLGSMFTPEWRKITDTSNGNNDGTAGLFDFSCRLNNANDCAALFNSRPTWEKVVIIALIVVVVLEALAVIWTVSTFFLCCCRKNMLHPLGGFALFSAAGLAVALGFFYTHYKEEINGQNWNVTDVSQLRSKSNLGYSFFLGCGALVANIVALFIGGILSCMVPSK